MTAIGGSIESVSIRGRLFPVASDADSGRQIGGFTNEVQANGNGTARLIKTRVPWQLDGLAVEIDEARGDSDFLQEVADQLDYVTIAVTYASRVTYQGKGTITGEFPTGSQNTTSDVTLMGPQKLTQQ